MTTDREIEIIYHDQHIVVVDKHGGMLAVPGRGPAKQDSVAIRLQKIFPEMINQPAVHRLDMYTSGLMVFAVTKTAHRRLSMQFEKRGVSKKYIALVEGNVVGEKGEIQLPFRLDPDNRPLQVYDPVHGKIGITQWRKLRSRKTTTLLEFIPVTGRTHQLRVHASHPKGLNCPIVGDSLYGSGKDGDKMMLHAKELGFLHPAFSKEMFFCSNPPF